MRNLGLIISFWLAAISLTTNALALGLGEIEVNSFLNQPLKAEIEVISARPGEIDDLLVGLASRDAFTRAGLSRPNNLSELRFAVKKSEEGDSAVILLTTKGAIKEPFLNFLVEADWSKGRLLREFTVLLDPPFYADSPAPAPQPEPEPVVESTEATVQTPQPIVESTDADAVSDTETINISEPIALSESESTPVDQSGQDASDVAEVLEMVESAETDAGAETDDVMIASGDTLWSIASNLQGSGHSMSQIMLAIQRANPDAFGDNNINNMKVGSVLRIPDASEMGEIDQQQAYAQVLEQNGLWDDYVAQVTGVPAVSTETAEADTETEAQAQETESSGELNLLTPGDGESDAAGLQSEGEDANELRVKLALAEEELDASRIDNQEQESRIAELEARLSKFEELQKMVEIEDDSLAQLQSDQAQASDQSEEQIAANETISEQQQLDDQDELLEEVLGDDSAAEITTGDNSTDATESDSDTMVEDTAAESITDSDVIVEEQSSTPPVPVIVTETESEPSILDGIVPDDILDMLPGMGDAMPSGDSLAFDPVMLGGLGGIILLLIGLVVYRRKKSADTGDGEILINDPIFASDEDEEDDLTPIHLAEGAFEGLDDDSEISMPDASLLAEAMADGEEDEQEQEEDDFAKTAIVSKDDMPEPEMPTAVSTTDEQDDILNEADVYLAYNLYDNAEELLTQSLEVNPDRADYRSKLLDTHFATKNADAFIREAETLKSMGDAANRYWDRVLVMGYELVPDNALFAGAKDSNLSAADLEISKPAEADFDLGASEDDTNFSTTDFDLGEEDTNTFEATDIAKTDLGSDEAQEPQELFDIDDNDDININAETDDIPDDIADIDFSLDEADDSVEEMEVDADLVDFDLPDDLDLGSDDEDDSVLDFGVDDDLESTSAMEASTAVVDTAAFAAELEESAGDDGTPNIEATAVMDLDGTLESDIDFGMEDTAMISQIEEGTGEIEFDLGDLDDDDPLEIDLGVDAETPKTGTFAPGDFDDLEDVASADGFDDIEDLMLPDDVDEVSTKLDLARAFIDMGDAEGARSSLDEVMSEGNDEQKTEAQSLLDQL